MVRANGRSVRAGRVTHAQIGRARHRRRGPADRALHRACDCGPRGLAPAGHDHRFVPLQDAPQGPQARLYLHAKHSLWRAPRPVLPDNARGAAPGQRKLQVPRLPRAVPPACHARQPDGRTGPRQVSAHLSEDQARGRARDPAREARAMGQEGPPHLPDAAAHPRRSQHRTAACRRAHRALGAARVLRRPAGRAQPYGDRLLWRARRLPVPAGRACPGRRSARLAIALSAALLGVEQAVAVAAGDGLCVRALRHLLLLVAPRAAAQPAALLVQRAHTTATQPRAAPCLFPASAA